MAKRLWAVGSMVIGLLLLSACGPSSAAPTPTSQPAPAPTKAAAPAQATTAPAQPAPAEPTKAAAPTAAAKVDYPLKGRPIEILVPYPAGGNVDLSARLVVPTLEKELGVPVNVVNKAGAASQIASTELAKAKPDGHTLMWVSLTALLSTYLDPEKQAVYHRKDFLSVGQVHWTPVGIAVNPNGPYKSFDDLIAATKAKPETVKAGTSGLLGTPHMAIVLLDAQSGGTFAPVHFPGGPDALAQLIGGHIDSQFEGSSIFVSPSKSGNVKVIGLFDDRPSKTFPDAVSLPAKGYKIIMGLSLGLVAPAGTSKEAIGMLSRAMEKATKGDDFIKKSEDLGFDIRYMNAEEYDKLWTDLEGQVASVIKKVRGQVREK